MDYLNYKVEDFISDESFQRYCLGKDERDVRFWKKWKEDHPQKHYELEEAELFVRSMQMDISKNAFDYSIRKQVIRERLYEKISTKSTHRSSHRGVWLLVAASFIFFICALAAIVYRQGKVSRSDEFVVNYVEKVNPAGMRSVIQLSDGTRVNLNAKSRVRYPVSFSELSTREVELEGEAFFEVTHDKLKPFIVHSGHLKTTVMGTSFNIKAYEKQPMSVALVTGKVSVTKIGKDEKPVSLEPGQSATLAADDGKISMGKFNSKKMLSWKDGILYFDKASENEVIEKLESWYGVKITLGRSPAKKWGYTGEFKNKSLKEVLISMSFAMDFDYEIKGNTVLINNHETK